ncbi:histidine phosphatase family protein [uncultured Roseibium sp.]|uniref:histidine phosphatase family protein n=1 Tax=uncultured Roseibium sp. TaxID=1936171 RepID=UPI0032175D47
MTGPQAALIRHAEYRQRKGVPSALQPFPLTARGETQAQACGEDLATLIARDGLTLDPVVHCSCQLRAWQTARIACDVLAGHGHEVEILQTSALAERSVGSAANLTLEEIEAVLEADPRFEAPPPNWKSDSDYCLPLEGAESLMMAGKRVADHLTLSITDKAPGTLTLFFGHGASFRHAAHLLGVLNRDEIARFSMHHARPLQICHNRDGTWAHSGGAWKIRQQRDRSLD